MIRYALKKDGVTVGYTHAEGDLNLGQAKKLVPDADFDQLSVLDEVEFNAAEDAKYDQAIKLDLASVGVALEESERFKAMLDKSKFATKEGLFAALLSSLMSRESEVVLSPANDDLVVDNFQDGNSKASFNLQVRNATGDAVKFVAIVRDVPYANIPDIVAGDYELVTTEADTGYTHTFSGKLSAYASISITGGVPSPAGVGKTDTSPELYLG